MQVLVSIGCLGVAAVGTIFSPALYHAFTNAAGFEGHMIVSRPIAPQLGEAGPPLTVRFDTNVMPGLPWDFTSERSVIETQVGVPMIAYFKVKNRANASVIGRATFNVTPDPAAYHFMKMDSFCFKNESLAPGESARGGGLLFRQVDTERPGDGWHTRGDSLLQFLSEPFRRRHLPRRNVGRGYSRVGDAEDRDLQRLSGQIVLRVDDPVRIGRETGS
jgi:cytochrome c oxidase assembly protein subunit 11